LVDLSRIHHGGAAHDAADSGRSVPLVLTFRQIYRSIEWSMWDARQDGHGHMSAASFNRPPIFPSSCSVRPYHGHCPL